MYRERDLFSYLCLDLHVYLCLYFIFIFLAFDELFQIHGIFMLFPELAKKLPGIFHFPWVIPYGIAVAIFGLYFAKFTLNLPKKIKRLFLMKMHTN